MLLLNTSKTEEIVAWFATSTSLLCMQVLTSVSLILGVVTDSRCTNHALCPWRPRLAVSHLARIPGSQSIHQHTLCSDPCRYSRLTVTDDRTRCVRLSFGVVPSVPDLTDIEVNAFISSRLVLGLRASGNLPVSYVLTGDLPVTYHQ